MKIENKQLKQAKLKHQDAIDEYKNKIFDLIDEKDILQQENTQLKAEAERLDRASKILLSVAQHYAFNDTTDLKYQSLNQIKIAKAALERK